MRAEHTLINNCGFGFLLAAVGLGDDLLDVLEDGGVLERGQVSQSVELVAGNLAQQTANNLARSGLRQGRNEVDLQRSAI